MSPNRPCDDGFRVGRLAKARGFFAATEILEAFLDDEEDETGEAYVTLCVHVGIAASDVVCCTRLGEYPSGENHREALATLARADKEAAKHLGTLLSLKTRAGYGPWMTSPADRKRAGRAARALLSAADAV